MRAMKDFHYKHQWSIDYSKITAHHTKRIIDKDCKIINEECTKCVYKKSKQETALALETSIILIV